MKHGSRNMLSYLQSGQEVACSPRPTPCWRNVAPRIKLTSSIPHARRCPDCARARSDIIPVLAFSPIWLPRILIWNGSAFVIPSCHHPPFHFVHCPRTSGHECLFMTYTTCTHTVALTHHRRVVPKYCTGGAPRFIAYLALFWGCDYCGVYILIT